MSRAAQHRGPARASKEEARYTRTGTPQEHCGICRHYQPPSACEEVAGAVIAGGWCKFFATARASENRKPAREA